MSNTIIAIIAYGTLVLVLIILAIAEEKKEKKKEEKPDADITTHGSKSEDEIREQINSDAPKERKAPVLAIVACCLLGAFILGQIGNTLELTGGRFDARLVAYTIGVLSLAIAALVLMIIDTVKRMR